MFVLLNQSKNASVIKVRAFFVLFILGVCKIMFTSVCAIQKLRLNDRQDINIIKLGFHHKVCTFLQDMQISVRFIYITKFIL